MKKLDSNKKHLNHLETIDSNKFIIKSIYYQIDNSLFNELLFKIECEYPHISKKLKLLIGYSEFEIEMNKLLFSNRLGRQGFSKSAFSNLLKMSSLHTEIYGQLLETHDCVWSKNRA